MALNTEAIRIVRDLEYMINIEKNNVETLQELLCVPMSELGNRENKSTGLSSLSSSYQDSMTENYDSSSSYSSYLSISTSTMSSEASDED